MHPCIPVVINPNPWHRESRLLAEPGGVFFLILNGIVVLFTIEP